MELIDPLFYDFEDPEFIYDLDRRHRIELKGRNVVRQGIQWREEEMKQTLEEMKEEVSTMCDHLYIYSVAITRAVQYIYNIKNMQL